LQDIVLTDQEIESLMSSNYVKVNNYEQYFENEYIKTDNYLLKYSNDELKICPIQFKTKFPIKIPQNNYPYLAVVNACIDPAIPLVCIEGKAGTGKSSSAVASLMYLWDKTPELRAILVKENILSTANGLGYLKGTLDEKKKPIFEYINSVLEFTNNTKSKSSIKVDDFELQTLAFLLGTTFYKSYIIVDEAQNLTPQNIDLLVTRVGKGSKMILLGDSDQNYNKTYKGDNGLVYLRKVMQGSKLFASIELTDCSLRSALVEEFLTRKNNYQQYG